MSAYYQQKEFGRFYPDRSMSFRGEKSKERDAIQNRAYDAINRVAEYMRLMEKAPTLRIDGLDGDYRLLAEYNGTVLAGHPTEYGVQFITWDWTYGHTGLWQGHYHMEDYEGAKQDFATRCGLMAKEQIFSPQQLAEVYRSIHETLDSGGITEEREKILKSAAEQIEYAVPDLDERVNQSNLKELEYGSQQGQTM